MFERGEDALLGAEPAQQRGVHPAAEHLERHLAREPFPQLFGEVDGGAPPVADRLNDSVAGDRLGGLR
jgi:hypothetical protein